jgi:hypothetical protein
MIRFYQARDSLEARQLVDALAARHIEATVLGEYLAGAAGELPAFGFPWVWLMDDGDQDIARDVLGAFLASQAAPADGDPWTCGRCGAEVDGGFDVCWRCGATHD